MSINTFPRPGLIVALTFGLSLLVMSLLIWNIEQNQLQAKRSYVQNLAQNHASLIDDNLDLALAINYALAATIRNERGNISNFNAFASEILPFYRSVSHLSLSPNGVITDVYPMSGNEESIGFNQLEDIDQNKEAIRARDSGKLTLAGPIELVQGGVGVVGRYPVFLTDDTGTTHFWGFTNVTVRMETLLTNSNLKQLEKLGMAYKLWRVHPDENKEQIIAAYQPHALIDAVEQLIIVPNGEWRLSMAPVAGWVDPLLLGFKILLGLMVSLLLGYQMHFMVYLHNRKQILEDAVRARTQELSTTKSQLEATLNAIPDLLFVIGSDGTIYDYRSSRHDLLLIPMELFIGKKTRDVLPPAAFAVLEEALAEAAEKGVSNGKCYSLDLAKGTAFFELSISCKTIDADQPARFVVLSRDITERKANEDQIKTLAFFDSLTHLPNRRLFLDRLEHAILTRERLGNSGALLFIDLDDFKSINDNRGHHLGDLLLVAVAERLRGCVRMEDTVARLGGDEFLILLEGLSAQSDEAAAAAQTICENIIVSINKPYLLAGEENFITPSIGIVLFNNRKQHCNDLLKQADQAMYHAKASGRNTFRFFDPNIQEIAAQRFILQQEMREALQQQQFELYYQLQVDQKNRIEGAEVLIRWMHPKRGIIPPMQFIPLAEESGLIIPLGIWILETACAQLLRWSTTAEMAHLSLSVNVSARQFRSPQFVERLLDIVARTGANPKRLKLELTESTLIAEPDDMIIKMDALQAAGIKLSLDDFGTGYSSLSYLKRLPINELKIDKSFVRDIHTDPDDAAIVVTIIRLAQSMELSVIAEGVETKAQRDWLEGHGCYRYQGYYFGKPVAIDVFNALQHSGSVL